MTHPDKTYYARPTTMFVDLSQVLMLALSGTLTFIGRGENKERYGKGEDLFFL